MYINPHFKAQIKAATLAVLIISRSFMKLSKIIRYNNLTLRYL